MSAIERDQPVITIVNVPPTEGSVLNGKRSIDVYSGFKTPALGSGVINAVLLDEGYENVTTIDPRFNQKKPRFVTTDGKFTEADFERLTHSDIVGISSMTRNREVSLRLIEQVRETNPKAIVIAGGPDPTFKPEKWLGGEKHADYVVEFEGEKTTPELVNALVHGESTRSIRGVISIENGQIFHRGRRPLLTEAEFSRSPIPFFPKYIRENSDANVIESKRGCPNNCEPCAVAAFCQREYRLKDEQTVIRDIREGDKRKPTFDVSDNFAHMSRLTDIKRGMQAIIDNGLNDREYYVQLDTVTVNRDPEFIDLAVKMGISTIFYGIESVDSEVLKGMNKSATADQNMNAVRIAKKKRIYVQGMEMMGGKNETKESIEKQKKWNRESRINSVQLFPVIPVPGSRLAERKPLLPIAEKDTNLISGHYVVAIPDGDLTCSELMQENIDAYRDFYSLRNLPNSFEPLRYLFQDPRKSIELTLKNLVVRIYGRSLLSRMINSEYTKNHREYLRQIDQEIYEKGKVVFEASKQ